MNRICIYPKDIQQITGKSERYCRNLIARIKKCNNKTKSQLVTLDEFCLFTGFKKEEINKFLK